MAGRFMSHREAAEYLGISEITLYNWVAKGYAPKSIRIGSRRKYTQADLDSWLAERVQAEADRLARIQPQAG